MQDLDHIGMIHNKVQLKADQEPVIVSVQEVMQEMRPNVIFTNSFVGAPECNGQVENIFRGVPGKVRALKHQIEQRIEEQMFDNVFVMAWLVRWVAALLST